MVASKDAFLNLTVSHSNNCRTTVCCTRVVSHFSFSRKRSVALQFCRKSFHRTFVALMLYAHDKQGVKTLTRMSVPMLYATYWKYVTLFCLVWESTKLEVRRTSSRMFHSELHFISMFWHHSITGELRPKEFPISNCRTMTYRKYLWNITSCNLFLRFIYSIKIQYPSNPSFRLHTRNKREKKMYFVNWYPHKALVDRGRRYK